MKNFLLGSLKGLGICLGCFILFVVMQFIVSNVASLPVGFKIGREMRAEMAAEGNTAPSLTPELMQEMNARQAEIMAPYVLPLAELGGLCAVGVIALIALIRRKKVSEALGFKKVAPAVLGKAAIIAVCFNAVVMLYVMLTNMFLSTGYQEAASAVLGGDFIVTSICAAVCAPIIEEIIFRGTAFRGSDKGMPTVLAAALASVFFALAHGSNIIWLSYTFAMGLIACYLVKKYDSILPSIIFHVVFNLLGGVILPYCPAAVVWVYMILGVIATVVLVTVMIVKTVKSKKIEAERRPEIVTAA